MRGRAHESQVVESASFSAPQLEQARPSGSSQDSQNKAVRGFVAPQFGHWTVAASGEWAGWRTGYVAVPRSTLNDDFTIFMPALAIGIPTKAIQ